MIPMKHTVASELKGSEEGLDGFVGRTRVTFNHSSRNLQSLFTKLQKKRICKTRRKRNLKSERRRKKEIHTYMVVVIDRRNRVEDLRRDRNVTTEKQR